MRNPFIILLLSLATTALIYWPGLAGPLMFDDAYNLAPLGEWLSGSQSWHWVVFNNNSGMFGRPVAMASFVFNLACLGPGIHGLKLGNLILHLLNGVLVYALLTTLHNQGIFTRKQTQLAKWLPVIGTALWLMHPMLVSTVLYVVQRMAILSALFTLLAMLAYLRGRITLNEGLNRRAWQLLMFVPLFTILAALSKENGLLAPALCALIELFVFQPENDKKRPLASRIFIIFALVLPAILAVGLTLAKHPLIVDGYGNRPFTIGERLLTQGRVLWSYIGSLLMPNGPKLGLYHDDYPISRSLFEPATTAVALISWIGLLAVTYRFRRIVPGLALGLGIFLVGQALESSIFPLLIYFEHRNYLPSIGLVLVLLSLINHATIYLQQIAPPPKYMFIGLTCALLTTIAFTTFTRAIIWASEPAILTNGLSAHPDSRWLRMEAAAYAMKQNPPQSERARNHMQYLLLQPSPDTRRIAAVAMLIIDCSTGTSAKPTFISQAFDGQPDPIEADKLLIFERLTEGLMSKPCDGLPPSLAARELSRMLDRSKLPRLNFFLRRLRFKSAMLYNSAGDSKQALAQARLAYAGDSTDAPIAVMIAKLEARQRSSKEATQVLNIPNKKMSPNENKNQDIPTKAVSD